MFGLSKEMLLKRQIMLFLDKQTESVPSQAVTNDVQSVTNQTIRKYLQELQVSIEKLYSSEKMELQINRRSGIELIRRDTNFDALFEEILSQDIIYAVFQKLILSRSFFTKPFCEEQDVSLSKLRRKINNLNHFLNPFGLYVTVGKKVTMNGEESHIRFLFFSFLYFIHRRLTSIPWVNEKKYLDLAEQVCYLLYIEPRCSKVEMIGLWLFVNMQAHKENRLLETLSLQEYFLIEIPRPNFLTSFEDEDWQFFIAVLYATDLIDIDPNINFDRIHHNDFSEATRDWIEEFECKFKDLSIQEKKEVTLMMYKCDLLNKIMPLNDTLGVVFNSVDSESIKQQYPIFGQTFDEFWTAFSEKNPLLVDTYIKSKSFMLALKLSPAKLLFTAIDFSLVSSLTLDDQERIKQQLTNYFYNKAKISFIHNPKKAEIIVTTEAFEDKEVFDGEMVVINPVLTQNDLNYLEETIEKVATN